ncbi:delta-like protein 4 [Pecten maximus]|uniref:delta-like protein 4 n=1 Tax=Pecten maximus TaxID=6579 RepID=UPI001458398A|nr:delta-like protein 4 [Pecten maximus]
MATISRTGLILLCIITVVSTGGTGSLRLLTYDNPTQQLATGQCCDHFIASNCLRNQCDPKFTVCLNQQPASSRCSLLREESYVFNDTTSVTFTDQFGPSSPNPLHFSFTSWKTGFIISVTVTDFDNVGTSDTMDIMVQSENVNLAGGPVDNGLSLRGSKGRLRLEYKLECDPGFYGDCSLSCTVKNNSYCSPSGTLVCVPGFTGRYCDTDIDDCQSNPCINGGTCRDGNNSFTCMCPQGRAGPLCNVAVSTTQVTTTPTTHVMITSSTASTTSTTVSNHSDVTSTPSVTTLQSTSVITSDSPSVSSPLTSSVPTSAYQTNSTAMTSISTKPTNGSSSQYMHADPAVTGNDDNTGAVVGGVVGGLMVLLMVLLTAGYFIRKYVIKKKTTIGTDRTSSTDQLTRESLAVAASPPIGTALSGQQQA